MNREALQNRIDGCRSAGDMADIALSYLRGTVVRDKVAAEAWLLRAIGAEDPTDSPRAMGIYARELLGADQILPASEIPVLRERLSSAQGREKEELEALLALI